MSSRLIDCLGTTADMAAVFSDSSMLQAMSQFELALVRVLADRGIIPASASAAIAKAATESFDPAAIAAAARDSASAAIPFVQLLTERVGSIDPSAIRAVHHGATSQDVIDTALVLQLRRARAILARDHDRLARKLRALSGEHAGTIITARTLLQPAAPTTFGYKVAGWFSGIHESWQVLEQSFDEGLLLQFGGPCGTLEAFGDRGPEIAVALAAELGLRAPAAPWHTRRHRIAAIVCNCGIYTGAVGKIARDLTLLMQGEVAEAAEPGGGSSSMAHKRNPAAATIALAATVRVPTLVAAYLAGMPHEHERATGGWQAEWQTVAEVVQATASALDAMAGAIEGLSVDERRMRANLAAAGPAVNASPEERLGAAEIFRRRLLGRKE